MTTLYKQDRPLSPLDEATLARLYEQRRAGMLNAMNTALNRYGRVSRYHNFMQKVFTRVAFACFKAEQWCLDRRATHRAWINNP